MSERESKYFLIIILLIFFGLFILILKGFIAALILGTIFSGLAAPLYRELLKKLKNKSSLAALLAVIAVSLVIVLPFLGILTLLTKEAFAFFTSTREQFLNPEFLSTLEPIASQFGFNIQEFLETQLEPTLKNLALKISSELGGLLSNAFNLALNFFVMLVTVFYMLRDGGKLADFLMKFSPLKTSEEFTLYETFTETSKAVFYGNFVAAVVQGGLGGLGFVIFGLGAPVLWGAVMAFLALIPILGPYLVFLPAGIYLLATGKTTTAVIFLLYNILIVSSVDNLIKPKLISDKIKIHPMLILLSILGGLKVFGLLGIIYGPVIIAIFMALLKVYLEHERIHGGAV